MSENKTLIFSFAIIADTHIMPAGVSDTAPYAVLNKANQRIKRVIEDLKFHDPEFVIHLGDMVRPFPALPNYDEVCRLALSIFEDIPFPVHYLPGNHDIGDKHIASAPAPQVSDAFLSKYKKHFGDTFGAFSHQGIQFVTLNASVLNSGLSEESDQWAWLEQFTKDHAGKRSFVFIHYPPYLTFRDEQPHYDNIDEPGRSHLLDLLRGLSVEGIFAGHVHHFFYNRDGQTDMYCLPSTAFTRHDFSELFSIEPGAEFGRDDAKKLGYAVVDVFAESHAVRLIHVEDKSTKLAADVQKKIKPLHPREGYVPPIGVQLRHDWNKVLALPTNGPLDDFVRKKARDDYPILSTWQIGLTWLRVPLDDLDLAISRDRMGALKAMGQRFIVATFDIPNEQGVEKLLKHALLIEALEVVLPPDKMMNSGTAIKTLRRQLKKPIYVGPLLTSAENDETKTEFFAHKTSFGFRAKGFAVPEQLSSGQKETVDASDGLLFQISSDEDVISQLAAIDKVSLKLEKFSLTHLAMSQKQPAQSQFDEIYLAKRTALACIGAYALSNGLVILDTLMDIDRGDFPRSGLIDRRGNMNLSGQYLKTLMGVLGRDVSKRCLVIKQTSIEQTYTFVQFQKNTLNFCLYLQHESQLDGLENFQKEIGPLDTGVDLSTGKVLGQGHIERAISGIIIEKSY